VDPPAAPHHKATQKHRAVEIQKSSQKLTELGPCDVITKSHPKRAFLKNDPSSAGKLRPRSKPEKNSPFYWN
jgi:hypothetical protein